MIFVNFKTYKEGSGDRAIGLSKVIDKVSKDTGVEVFSCPQSVDLREVASVVRGRVWAQHVDGLVRGKTTGWFPAEIAKELGCKGTLLNHSEHKLDHDTLSSAVSNCKEVGLKTVVLVDSIEEAQKTASLNPDYIGYEPPELIGSKNTSVAQSKPEVIEKIVKAIKDIPILVGAGIKNGEDVRTSLARGAVGIIPSSSVVLAEKQEEVLRDLAGGFQG